MARANNIMQRVDAWANVLTGVGTAALDALRSGLPFGENISAQLAEDTFRGSYLGHKICAKPAKDAVRGWVKLVIEPDEDATDEERAAAPQTASAIVDELGRLGARKVFREATTWARAAGGCVVFVGAQDGQAPDQPLREESIRSIDFLNVHQIDRVQIVDYYTGPLDAKHGEPKLYRVSSSTAGGTHTIGDAETVTIHESRILWFRGELTTPEQRRRNNGWDDSIFVRGFEVLQRNGQAWAALGHLLNKSNVLAFKVQGFTEFLGGAEGAESAWLTRMRMNKLAMSINSWLGIDAETEEIENITVSFAGVPDVMDRLMLEVSAAFDIPAAILWGREPAGMNATGDSDWKAWDDYIQSVREDNLQPPLERLIKLLMLVKGSATKGAEPDTWRVKWNPLRDPDPKTQAETRKIEAETAAVYIADGVWDEDEVAVSRFGEQGYQSDVSIDLDKRRERLEAKSEIDAAEEIEGQQALAAAAKAALEGGDKPGEDEPPAPDDKPKPPAPGKDGDK